MKIKYRLSVLMVLTCAIILYVSLNLYWSWRFTEEVFTKNTYLDQVEFTVNKLEQHTYRYRSTHSPQSIQRWQKQHRQFEQLLATVPELSPQQQTLHNSIEKHNDGLLVLFNAVVKLERVEGEQQLTVHLLEKLIAKMQTIREDSRGLSVLSRQDIIDALSQKVFWMVPVLLIGFCLIALVSFTLTRWLHRSLNKLQMGLDALGDGKVGDVIPIADDDDFKYIYEHFNEMSQKLFETTISRDSLQQMVDERTAVLEKLANTDPLTQVATRRLLFQRGHIEFSRSVRYQQALSVLMLDCDYFKKINDCYGHVVGDNALMYLCQLFQEEIRDIDLLCRYGGEEFVIILPDTNTHDAEQVGKRIQQRLCDTPFIFNQRTIPITISIGLASFGVGQQNFEQLLDNADGALLSAKANGRNRMEISF